MKITVKEQYSDGNSPPRGLCTCCKPQSQPLLPSGIISPDHQIVWGLWDCLRVSRDDRPMRCCALLPVKKCGPSVQHGAISGVFCSCSLQCTKEPPSSCCAQVVKIFFFCSAIETKTTGRRKKKKRNEKRTCRSTFQLQHTLHSCEANWQKDAAACTLLGGGLGRVTNISSAAEKFPQKLPLKIPNEADSFELQFPIPKNN